MSQTYTLDAATFLGTTTVKDGRTAISNSAETLRSSFAGTAAPTSPAPVDGQLFFKTSTNELYMYSDAAWYVIVGNVNTASTAVARFASLQRTLAATVITANFYVFSPSVAITVLGAVFYSSAAVAVDGTNYYTIKLRNIGTGGAGTTDLASKATNATAIVADTAYGLGTISSAAVAANEMLVMRIEKTAVPTALNLAESAFFIKYQIT